ncbi:MAG: histone deacetylase [Bacteroidetes bacterium]|jgi:acetoin utilization deacetylase AcuC-like enzyme|nr:histone deacetylase [Bacteroidota bacterium]
MSRLTFLYHPDVLLHDTGAGHPERRLRVETLVAHLMSTDLWSAMDHRRPEEAPLEAMTAVHTSPYLETVERTIANGETLLDDGDTRVCPASWRAARLAAGAAMLGIDLACGGERAHVFSAMRPPGHHAESSRAMGFCIVNHVAVAARHAQRRYGIGRVAIVDWDVHHGNGTEEIFWRDPSVLYVSLHQYPLWPGTGAASDAGDGDGRGTTVNCPLPPGSGEQAYERAFRERVVPALTSFGPELLIISAGFDAHRDDPLANMDLRAESFGRFTQMVGEATSRSLSAGIVSVLEGGYDLRALSSSVEVHLRELSAA